jgi:uncharacterized membrane protein
VIASRALGDGPTTDPGDDLATVLRRNIGVLRERRETQAGRAGPADRLARTITGFAGSMSFVWLHLILVAAWIGLNLAGPRGLRFDPSFVVLAMAASVEAIFLSTFVLISQNRIADAERQRAELDLQINLLAEHEVTRLIDLTTRIAERLDIPANDAELQELRRDVAPEVVLERIRATDNTSSGAGR